MSATQPPRDKPEGRRLGDVKIVAKKLDCSTTHIRRLNDVGRMPAPIKLGALVRWDLDVIDEWIASGCPSCRRDGCG